jgi:hypothetical protein
MLRYWSEDWACFCLYFYLICDIILKAIFLYTWYLNLGRTWRDGIHR